MTTARATNFFTSPLAGKSLPSGIDPRVDREVGGRGVFAKRKIPPAPTLPHKGGGSRLCRWERRP
jgi:hypothetical protein